jgi:hypothetical protein
MAAFHLGFAEIAIESQPGKQCDLSRKVNIITLLKRFNA